VVTKRVPVLVASVALAVAMFAAIPGAGASGARSQVRDVRWAIQYLRQHGHFPLRGEDVLAESKAHAAAVVAQRTGKPAASASGGAAPVVGVSWQGISDSSVTPPDTNGAIGPSSYVEIINLKIGIYNRSGGLITSATLGTLTGHSNFNLSDPMVLWDPASQRFFYNVWDVAAATMAWGFSKDSNPTTVPGSWCNYTSSFGYQVGTYPDYPKLGQTKEFLMIGINFYPSLSNLHATQTDLLWISKYQDPNPVTTCPASNTFTSGRFQDLRNADNSIGFTPVPAIQTDPSSTGTVITESDIECPDICGTGTLVTTHAFRPDPHNPAVPQFQIKGRSITVGGFESPPDAPQKGSTDTLDTLDGRMTHAVSGIDPAHGNALAVWVAHTVLGGAGAQINWYEINPLPPNHPTLLQSGTVSDPSLYVFNAGISNDRACSLTTCAHGDAMVLGFSTSSSNAFAASQMVSKIGTGTQSAMVVVKQSTTFDNDFSCTPTCRWGDYGGATPDPTKTGGTHGEVWLTNEWTNGTNQTWNWEALP
jgi:hypothetical protein